MGKEGSPYATNLMLRDSAGDDGHMFDATPASLPMGAISRNEMETLPTQDISVWSYPMYFGNIITPQEYSSDPSAQRIPDVSAYMQEDNIWDGFDFSDSNILNFDALVTPLPEAGTVNVTTHDQGQVAGSPASAVSQDSLRARFDAFRRSPWYV
jgi:hypothetical protein